jgi:hypothetical protein
MPSATMQKTKFADYNIINWYITITKGLLSYYGHTKNLNDLKRLVHWALRYSLFATLGFKHKKSIKWTINNFGFNPKIIYKNKVITNFPNAGWINSRSKNYLSQIWDNKNLHSTINSKYIELSKKTSLFDKWVGRM